MRRGRDIGPDIDNRFCDPHLFSGRGGTDLFEHFNEAKE